MSATAGLHIVTGGPGSGKTSLIAALAEAGMRCGVEAGRAVIRAEQAAGGDALPWADRAAFAGRMLAMDRATWAWAMAGPRPVMVDRGLPDVIGYLRLCALPVPADAIEAVQDCRYDPLVFIAPVWPEIFVQDAERRQDIDEARRTHDIMALTYRALGYRPVPLPKATIADRVRFVLAAIGTR